MSSANNKIDIIYQYSLLLAGDMGDFRTRRLGPIHLLKYLYLADCAFSKRNEGNSFSGIIWTFHNFGPWNVQAHERIQHSMKSIGAEIFKFASDYSDDDYFRFELEDSARMAQLEALLPPVVTRELKKNVKLYSCDTPELLEHVYRTEPMLNAAPGEILEFYHALEQEQRPTREEFKQNSVELAFSNKKKKKINQGVSELKNRLALSSGRKKLVDPSPEVSYDDVFFAGVEMLEDFEMPRFEKAHLTVEFEQSVWKSKTRKGIYGE